MTADWKSSLGALRDILPEGDAPQPEIPATESVAVTEKARLDIILDKKGRKGKAATIVCGFTCPDSEVDTMAARLKQRLGVGGSSRGGEILIQGDKRREVLDALTAMGYKARII